MIENCSWYWRRVDFDESRDTYFYDWEILKYRQLFSVRVDAVFLWNYICTAEQAKIVRKNRLPAFPDFGVRITIYIITNIFRRGRKKVETENKTLTSSTTQYFKFLFRIS